MADRKEFRDLADPERAHEVVASLDIDPGTETIPLRDARGRVLAERVDAGIDVPGFDRASMDGYAVRARDTFSDDGSGTTRLELKGAVHAGEKPGISVDPGTCVEISTGAVMPDGADAVVMVEQTTERNGTVEIRTASTPGENVMFAGADIAAGERALGPGTRLTPREIGLLSALGLDEVPVREQPTVGILSTGDELVRPGEELDSARGEIHDVNTYTVAAGVAEAGGDPRLYPHVGDDFEDLEAALRRAADECELVLSSGSTSAGAVDVVYRVIEEQGSLLLHGVAVKPGKPMLVGELEEAAYVGLPGYPVSALTIFRTFVAPAIRAAAGLPDPPTATITGAMAVRERYEEGRLRYMPVGLVETDPRETDTAPVAGSPGDTLVYPVDKGSGATTSLVEADGVVAIDPDTEYLAAGESVEVRLFSPEIRPPALLGMGEDDPALSRLLDDVSRPRYLAVGSREGLRRLGQGLPDVAVTAGPLDPDHASGTEVPERVQIGGWRREWGLVVPAENPSRIEGLDDLVDREVRFVNREPESGLRTSLANAVADLAAARDTDRHALVEGIDGFDRTVSAYESPARRVASGAADAGLGLRATAERLDMGFVPVDWEVVRVYANPLRLEKPAMTRFRSVLEDAEEVFETLPGYDGLAENATD